MFRNKMIASLAGMALMAGSLLVTASPAEAASFNVTVRADTKTTVVGAEVKVSGTLKGVSAKRTVYVQQKLAGKKSWKTVATAQADAAGNFAVSLKMDDDGTRYFRAYKPKEGRYKKDYSKTVKVKVYNGTVTVEVVPFPKTTVISPSKLMCEAPEVKEGKDGKIVRTWRDGKLISTETVPPVPEVTTVGGSPDACVTSLGTDSVLAAGGQKVEIYGHNLNTVTAATFGGVPAGITAKTTTKLTVTSPALTAGNHVVSLDSPGGQVKAGSVYAAPNARLDSVSPNTGSFTGGEVITLTGEGLSTTTGVGFTPVGVPAEFTTSGDGSMPASPAISFRVVNDQTLKVTVPPGITTSARITVSTKSGTVEAIYSYRLAWREPNAAEAEFLRLVNHYRTTGYNCDTWEYDASKAVAPVTWDGNLSDLSLSHSTDAHHRWDAYGELHHDRVTHLVPGLTKGAYRYGLSGSSSYGEIMTGHQMQASFPITATEPTPADVAGNMNSFLNSWGHCKTIMDGPATKMGVGYHWTNLDRYTVDTLITANVSR